MKRIVLFIIFTLLGTMIHAQNANDSTEAQIIYDQAYQAALNDEYDKAMNLLNQGVNQAEGELVGNYHFLYGFLWEVKADPYYYNAPEQAYEFYEKAFDHYHKAGAKDWSVVALKHMGILKTYVNKFEDALNLWEFALEYADKTQQPAVEIMIHKKNVHEKLNQYDQAAMLGSELTHVYGNVSDLNTKALINIHLAKEACGDNNYVLARAYFDELDKLMSAMSDEYRDYFKSLVLNDKHSLLVYEGKYIDAADLMLKSIEQKKQTDPESHSLVLLYINLINNYLEMGEKSLALDALHDVIDLISRLDLSGLEKSHQFLAIASAYTRLDMQKEALDYVRKSQDINVLHDDLLLMQANVYYAMGQLKDARKVYEEYSEYIANYYSRHSMQYAKALWYLANINAFCKDYDTASDYYVSAVKLATKLFADSYRYISISERESFWRDFYKLFSEMTSFGLAAGFEQDEFTCSAYDALLLSKGLLLSSDKSLAKIVYGSGDQKLVRIFECSKNLNTEIEVYKASGEIETDKLAKMYDELHVMESELQKYAGSGDEYMSFLDVDFKKIASSLRDNEVVVDFTDFRGKKNPGDVFYAAFVYRKGWDYPKMIEVFKGKELDEIVAAGTSWDIYSSEINDLAKLLFKPLKKHIDKGDVIYWVPSGDLHKISVESLLMQAAPDADLTVRQLSSARMIVENKYESDMHSAVLYGGLEYSGGDSSRFDELPESYEEVCLVKDILEGADCNVQILDGLAGTEQSFVEYSNRSPELLHFSTHGFYYSSNEAESVNALSGFNNAMFLSGLILSGGNNEWTGTNLIYDGTGGVLTADDIAKVDLSGTRLVVLSACETAQGEVTAEGVYGLQRAFKKAGVNEIVMTLWHVNDIVSKHFMAEFYTGLVENDFQTELALMHAKKTLRDAGYSPYYWAGYVLLD